MLKKPQRLSESMMAGMHRSEAFRMTRYELTLFRDQHHYSCDKNTIDGSATVIE